MSIDTETEMTVREALALALDQALAADDRVLLLGEDMADPAGGVERRHRGPVDQVRGRPGPRHADLRGGDRRGRHRRGPRRHAGRGRDHDHGLHRHRHRPDREPRRQAAVHVGRPHDRVPITVRTAVFGGLGSGATHSQSLEAWFMHIPGLKVIVPSTPRDAKGLLTSAIFDPDPCVFMETVLTYGARGPVPDDPGFSDPARRSRRQARGQRCDRRHLRTRACSTP